MEQSVDGGARWGGVTYRLGAGVRIVLMEHAAFALDAAQRLGRVLAIVKGRSPEDDSRPRFQSRTPGALRDHIGDEACL